jgi:hypothetical protein
MLIKPNNHRVNAAEQAIQTFKLHFMSALATTDSNFPLQLWDRLTPQNKATSKVQSKMIFMQHQQSSCHLPVVGSFFIW